MSYDYKLLDEIMRKNKISAGVISRVIGCSKVAISLMRNGKYSAKKSNILKLIVDYLLENGIENANDILNLENQPTDTVGTSTAGLKRSVSEEGNQMISFKTLKQFGLKSNPFSAEIPQPNRVWVNDDITEVEEAIYETAMNQGFLLVVGEVGVGKSTILKKSLRRLGREDRVKTSLPSKYFVEKITSGFIADAMIQDFGNEDPHRNYRRRASQVREVLERNYNDNVKMVLIIDEAQGLHPNTLRALKRFWEGMGGTGSMLSIIIIGQPFIYGTLSSGNMKEVKQRLNMIELRPFNAGVKQLHSYINHKVAACGGNGIFTESAAAAISKRAKTPLKVNNICKAALISAGRLQETVITEEIIEGV